MYQPLQPLETEAGRAVPLTRCRHNTCTAPHNRTAGKRQVQHIPQYRNTTSAASCESGAGQSTLLKCVYCCLDSLHAIAAAHLHWLVQACYLTPTQPHPCRAPGTSMMRQPPPLQAKQHGTHKGGKLVRKRMWLRSAHPHMMVLQRKL
jgi:hypothetical protein